ncbi:Origin recognition complex subunit 5 [Geranomyces variabilis]|uniref:Origin recognition complex subunit 5 n=1 Tax=Geranomyces variabilis TaxID=109894 RepID=A0AAD5TQP1_9FUNG|nr:Origin recognition complex subunit 5 [Geranomyces variabilis]
MLGDATNADATPMDLAEDDADVNLEIEDDVELGLPSSSPTEPIPAPPSSPFPGRNKEVEQLKILLRDEHDAPSVIFITGLPSTGKTFITNHVLSQLPHRVAKLDCTERHTPRLLLESALAQLAGRPPEPLTQDVSGPWGTVSRCDNTADFVSKLELLLSKPPWDVGKTVLLFDNARKLRDMGPYFLAALIRIPEQVRLIPILITRLTLNWQDFRPRVDSVDPAIVEFPMYTREEVLQIIAQDCPSDEEPEFFTGFIAMLYEVFVHPCKDMRELRHLVSLLFPKYVEPVKAGKMTRQQTSKLFGNIQDHLRDALQGLYLRQISSSEWRQGTSTTNQQPSSAGPSKPQARAGPGAMDLPYYTKFLIIAAFLASYNPPRLDVRFFAKDRSDEVTRRKGGKGRAGRVQKEGGKMRQQLLGPKAFPVERMLAIFYSILPDEVDSTVDIQMQIASLTTLRLLVRVTAPDRLDGVKCKCNASCEFVKAIGRSVRFDVGQYLYDFV